MKNILRIWSSLILIILCAYSIETNETSKSITNIQRQLLLKNNKKTLLIKRFIEYWNARKNGNMKKAWEYEMPYQRYLNDFNLYKDMVAGYKGAKTELLDIKYIDPDTAIITRKVDIGEKRKIIKKDKWFYIKDNWYHKFYQTIFPPENDEEAQFQ